MLAGCHQLSTEGTRLARLLLPGSRPLALAAGQATQLHYEAARKNNNTSFAVPFATALQNTQPATTCNRMYVILQQVQRFTGLDGGGVYPLL